MTSDQGRPTQEETLAIRTATPPARLIRHRADSANLGFWRSASSTRLPHRRFDRLLPRAGAQHPCCGCSAIESQFALHRTRQLRRVREEG